MKKIMNKKTILIISIICIVIIGIVITLLLINNKNTKKNEKKEEKQKEKTQVEYKPTYNKPEEVVNHIKEKGDTNVKYVKEENGCWYFKSSKRKYEYCQKDDTVRAIESITIGKK